MTSRTPPNKGVILYPYSFTVRLSPAQNLWVARNGGGHAVRRLIDAAAAVRQAGDPQDTRRPPGT